MISSEEGVLRTKRKLKLPVDKIFRRKYAPVVHAVDGLPRTVIVAGKQIGLAVKNMHMRVTDTHIGEYASEVASLQIADTAEAVSYLINISRRQIVIIAERFVKFQSENTERCYIIC